MSNDLASWAIRNNWVYNFIDGLWWQYQEESGNYLKKTTEELAVICLKSQI